MALIGAIEEIGITDILQLLALSLKTGILTVRNERNEEVGVVFFKDGRVAYGLVSSEKLEDRLVHEGRASKDQISKVKSTMKEGELFEDALLRSKLLDVLDMRKYLRKSAEEAIYVLCGQKKGIFQFQRRDLPINPDLSLYLKTDFLIIESSRRIDEWSRIREKLPSSDSVLELSPKHKNWKEKTLKSTESSFLSLIDQGKSLREIYKVLGEGFSTLMALHNLLEMKILQVVSPSKGKDDLNTGRRHLVKGDMEKALEMLEKAVDKGVDEKEAHLFLGDVFLRQGDFQKALQEYDAGRNLDPQDPEILLRMGYSQAKQGNLTLAITYWENFLLQPFDLSAKEKAEKVMKEALVFQKDLEESLFFPIGARVKKKDLKHILEEINKEKGVLGSMVIDDTGLILEKAILESEKVEESAAFSAAFLLLAKRSLHLLRLGDLERAVLDKGDWRIHLIKLNSRILVVLTGSETHLELQIATFQTLFESMKGR